MPDPIEEARDQAVFGVESAIDALFALYSEQGAEPFVNDSQHLIDAWEKLSAVAAAVAAASNGRAAA